MESVESLVKYVTPICDQAFLIVLVSIFVAIKLMKKKDYLEISVVLISSSLTVIVLNCLCKSGWEILSWLYAISFVLNLLILSKIINSNMIQI
jgi:hypothetical protein